MNAKPTSRQLETLRKIATIGGTPQGNWRVADFASLSARGLITQEGEVTYSVTNRANPSPWVYQSPNYVVTAEGRKLLGC